MFTPPEQYHSTSVLPKEPFASATADTWPGSFEEFEVEEFHETRQF